MKNLDGKVTAIETEYYEALLKKQKLLDALISLGVEDWEAFNIAVDMIREEKES